MRVKKNETNLRKRSRGRKALLLGLVLLLALSPVNWGGVFGGPAAGESGVYADTAGGNDGDGSAGDTASGPAITVVGVNVKNTDTLEVGIQVGGPDQPLFQSVGLVLEYDRSRLTPIDWQPGWQTVESQTTNASGEAITTSSTAVVAGQEDWKSLAVYTPTWINSGTAQVYEPGDGTGAGAAGKGYLLLQANTEYPYSLPTARQIVTVKFQYTGDSVGTGGAIVKAGSFDEVGLALAGAEGSGLSEGKKVAYTSRIKHVGLYHTGKAFYYNGALRDDGSGNAQEDPALADRKLTVNFSASIVEGETQQAAGGGAGDVAVLSFYDWDETMLGNSIISKTAGEEEIKEALTAFSQSQYAVTGGGEKPTEFPADLANESYVDNAALPLTYKKGYNFAGWVRADGKEGSEPLTEAFTAYETLGETPETDGSYPEESFNAARWKYEAGPNGGSWGNIVLKAGYVENAWCNYYNAGSGLDALTASYYSIVNNSFTYDRYGPATTTAGDYLVSFHMIRQNADGYGVSRLENPIVRLYYTIESGSVSVGMYNSVTIKNVDEQAISAVVPRLASNFTLELVEQGNAAVYTLGTLKSPTAKVYSSRASDSTTVLINGQGFIPEGTLGFINRECMTHIESMMDSATQNVTWANQTPALTFEDALIVDEAGDAYYLTHKPGLSQTNALQLMNIAKNKIAAYMMGKGMRALTLEEMKAAIDMNCGAAANNTAGQLPVNVNNVQLINVLNRIQAMYKNPNNIADGGGYKELTVNQIIYGIQSKAATAEELENLWCEP